MFILLILTFPKINNKTPLFNFLKIFSWPLWKLKRRKYWKSEILPWKFAEYYLIYPNNLCFWSGFFWKLFILFFVSTDKTLTRHRQLSSIYWFSFRNSFLCFSFYEKRKMARNEKKFSVFCSFYVIIGIDNSQLVVYVVYTNAFGVIWDALTLSGSCN